MQELEFTSDEAYLNGWLQFNVAFRASVAVATARVASNPAGGTVARAAACIECFQQYLFALEDLATWLAVLGAWPGQPLLQAMEVANARWTDLQSLRDAGEGMLIQYFRLPAVEGFREPYRSQYASSLASWAEAGRDIGQFVSREAQNGGPLANRLQGKLKHGLHFVVVVENGTNRAYFYANEGRLQPGERAELPSIRLSADGAELWARRTYDVCRFLAAMLRTVFVKTFGRDPQGAWRPLVEPNAELSMDALEASLERLGLPNLEWRQGAVADD